RVRRRVNPQVEIAAFRTAGSRLALAGDAYAGAFEDAGRDPHVDVAGRAVVLNGEAPRRAVIDVFQGQLEILFEVTARARPGRSCAAGAAARAFLAHAAAEERLKEIGERVLAPEHLAHFLLRHRP